MGHHVTERALEESRTTSSTTSTTNVVGLDDDIGYGIMRTDRTALEGWMIGNPVYNFLLGTLFEWGVAAHGLETTKYRKGEKSMAEVRKDLKIIGKKVGKQVGKDTSLPQ